MEEAERFPTNTSELNAASEFQGLQAMALQRPIHTQIALSTSLLRDNVSTARLF